MSHNDSSVSEGADGIPEHPEDEPTARYREYYLAYTLFEKTETPCNDKYRALIYPYFDDEEEATDHAKRERGTLKEPIIC